MHNIGHIICNFVIKNKPFFNQKLDFETIIIPVTIDDAWVEIASTDIRRCLNQIVIPEPAINCDYCKFDLN